MPPSRQERRKAERAAAKRAPAQAADAAVAAAALANLTVNPLGDWTTQAENPMALLDALGAAVVKRMAYAGDREARWSLGFQFVSEAEPGGGALGTAGSSPMADVGFALCTVRFPGRSPDCDASIRPLDDQLKII